MAPWTHWNGGRPVEFDDCGQTVGATWAVVGWTWARWPYWSAGNLDRDLRTRPTDRRELWSRWRNGAVHSSKQVKCRTSDYRRCKVSTRSTATVKCHSTITLHLTTLRGTCCRGLLGPVPEAASYRVLTKGSTSNFVLWRYSYKSSFSFSPSSPVLFSGSGMLKYSVGQWAFWASSTSSTNCWPVQSNLHHQFSCLKIV